VFGIVSGEEAHLLRRSPGRFAGARQPDADRAWRADAGRRCQGDVLKGDAAVLIALAAKAERSASRRRDGPAARSIRSAIRCSKRCGRCAAILRAEAGLPPYVIFHDSTLREMATARPPALPNWARWAGSGPQARGLWRRVS
jgi:ATP-dependent DNA helicase RecQ